MRETTAPTTPIRRITFCRRRSTPSQMTTMTQKNPPGLPEVQLQPPLLPAFAGTADIPLPALETKNLPGTRSGSSEGRRPRAYAGGPSFEFRSIIKPVLLIIIIILLLLIIKMIRPATDAKPDSTAAVSTESLAPETEAETVAAESTVYRTTDTVNVRPEPSTDTDRIGVLAPDTDVEYLRDYDEKWAVISYNGQEAYVSRDFIRQVSQ